MRFSALPSVPGPGSMAESRQGLCPWRWAEGQNALVGSEAFAGVEAPTFDQYRASKGLTLAAGPTSSQGRVPVSADFFVVTKASRGYRQAPAWRGRSAGGSVISLPGITAIAARLAA